MKAVIKEKIKKSMLLMAFFILIAVTLASIQGSSYIITGSIYDSWIPHLGAYAIDHGLQLHKDFHSPMGLLYNYSNYLAFVLIKTFPTSLHPNNLITISSSIIAIFLTLIFQVIRALFKTEQISYLILLLVISITLQARPMGDIFAYQQILWSGVYNNNIWAVLILQIIHILLLKKQLNSKITSVKKLKHAFMSALFGYICFNFKISSFIASLGISLAVITELKIKEFLKYILAYTTFLCILLAITEITTKYSYLAYLNDLHVAFAARSGTLKIEISTFFYTILLVITIALIQKSNGYYSTLKNISIIKCGAIFTNLIKRSHLTLNSNFLRDVIFYAMILGGLLLSAIGESKHNSICLLITTAIIIIYSNTSKILKAIANIFLIIVIALNLLSLGLIAIFKNYEQDEPYKLKVLKLTSNKQSQSFIVKDYLGFADLINNLEIRDNTRKNSIFQNLSINYQPELLPKPISFHNIEYVNMLNKLFFNLRKIPYKNDDKFMLLGFTNPLPLFLDVKIPEKSWHWLDFYINLSPSKIAQLFPVFQDSDFIFTPILTYDDSGDPGHQAYFNCSFFLWNLNNKKFELVAEDEYGLLFADIEKIKSYRLQKKIFLPKSKIITQCKKIQMSTYKRYNIAHQAS
ncbi:MAG: hypothetical protein VX335_01615 [Pseudomonadota bacterium]|nr:hypothetical protein [Pseudomonadota bacterium]